MELTDITQPIYSGMPVYKGRLGKRPQIQRVKMGGSGLRESRISLDSHTGTHIDAPSHVFTNGVAVDKIPLSRLQGPCSVFDVRKVRGSISSNLIETLPIKKGTFVLFRTSNELHLEAKDFVYIDISGAQGLAKKGVSGVGIDGLGIERDQAGHPTHKKLLSKGITIIEGLMLKGIKPGFYHIIVAPLKIRGGDAAPARVFLVKP